jgi:hypothetical protein
MLYAQPSQRTSNNPGIAKQIYRFVFSSPCYSEFVYNGTRLSVAPTDCQKQAEICNGERKSCIFINNSLEFHLITVPAAIAPSTTAITISTNKHERPSNPALSFHLVNVHVLTCYHVVTSIHPLPTWDIGKIELCKEEAIFFSFSRRKKDPLGECR